MRKLVFVSAVLLLVASAAVAAPTHREALSLPAAGSFTDAAGGRGTFSGTFNLTQFAVSGNELVAKGYLTGTLTDSSGQSIGSVMKAVTLPVRATSGASAAVSRRGAPPITTNATCDILHLDLGPLHLDLLGLTVDLSQIVLDIAAESGGGNLLGNLLCAVTNLLNPLGSLSDIVNLLNQILDILTGILP